MKALLLAVGLTLPGAAIAQTTPAPTPARRDIGNLTVENVPALPADVLARVEQYQNARGASVAD